MAFHRLARLADLGEGFQRDYRVAGEHLLLLVVDGRTHLLDARCPHMGVNLAHGSITAEGHLRCPGHALDFDLVTGANPKGLCPGLRLLQPAYDGPFIGVDL